MSSIVPIYRTISALLQSRSFAIDEYQREYKWDRKNIEELVTDLLSKFESSYREGDPTTAASQYDEYFLGSIIVTKRSNTYYLVDGQQRVTSLTLLLIYLYREATARNMGVVATIQPLIYSNNFGEKNFNLDIEERIPVVRALFNGEDYNADGKEESIQTILARYQDIQSLDLAGELGEGLESFIYWLMNNVGLIEISTESDAHAYAIFETMNDRGKPLSPVDMLKAYLLAPLTESDDRVRANRIWKSTVLDLISWSPDPDTDRDSVCIKAWLRAKYATTIRERKARSLDQDWELIGTTFHRWLRNNEERVGTGSAADNMHIMTEEFPFFARAYKLILEASRSYTPGLEPIFYNAHNDFTWQSTVLLAPLIVGDSDDIVRKKMAATAAYLDTWIMRRTINYIRVGYSSVSYTMFLLCRDIRDKPLDELIDILQEKLDSDTVKLEGSQTPERFGVPDLRLNQFTRRYIYHLLARLTAYVESESGQPDMFDKYVDRKAKNPADIEHIWANDYSQYEQECPTQQDFDEWRNNIGGLLLLPADVNRSYQDKPFSDKAPHYAKQNLFAASLTPAAYQHQPQFQAFVSRTQLPFKPYESFGKAEQTERRELVLSLAQLVWSPARLDGYRAGGGSEHATESDRPEDIEGADQT